MTVLASEETIDSTRKSQSWIKILALIIFGLMALIVLQEANPLFYAPGRDQGFFLYTGQELLEGKHLYTDIWDSKGPVVFWINALGMLSGFGTRWGIFLLEWLFLTGGAFILFNAFSYKWTKLVSLFSVAGLLASARQVIGRGNSVEEYSLFFSFILLFLLFRHVFKKASCFHALAIGALIGWSFMLRANVIGVGLVTAFVSAFWTFKNQGGKSGRHYLLYLLLGLMISLTLTSLPFLIRGEVGKMVDASILYNFSYSAQNHKSNLFNSILNASLLTGVKRFGDWGLLVLLGYFLSLFRLCQSLKKHSLDWIALVIVLLFPVEVVFSGISARGYGHYFICWLPVMGMMFAYLFDFAMGYLVPMKDRFEMPDRLLRRWQVGLLVVVVTMGYGPLVDTHIQSLIKVSLFRENGFQFVEPIAKFMSDRALEEDLVLVIGGQAGINIMSERRSLDAALFFPGLNNSEIGLEQQAIYFERLKSQKPKYVVDMSSMLPQRLPAIDPVARGEQSITEFLSSRSDEVLDYIWEHYYLDGEIDSYVVYRLKEQALNR